MERIKIVQVGVNHEHANGKICSLRKCLSDVFEVVGYVDNRDFSSNSPIFVADFNEENFAGLKKLTLDEALNYPGLQAAMIEVPNLDLVPMAMKFMEKGIAMHMDKPAGENLPLYKKLLNSCKEKRIPFQMGYMFRGNPAIRFMVEAVRNGWLGDIFCMEADMHHCYGGEEYQHYIGKFSGGIMFNLGCHLIDIVVESLGRPRKVMPFLKSSSGDAPHIHNNCMAVLEYENAMVTLKACSRKRCDLSGRRLLALGTKGSIEICPMERFGQPVELHLELAEPAGNLPQGKHVLKFPTMRDRYENQLREFAAMIQGKQQSRFSPEHDYLVHEVTLAASGYMSWQ